MTLKSLKLLSSKLLLMTVMFSKPLVPKMSAEPLTVLTKLSVAKLP